MIAYSGFTATTHARAGILPAVSEPRESTLSKIRHAIGSVVMFCFMLGCLLIAWAFGLRSIRKDAEECERELARKGGK